MGTISGRDLTLINKICNWEITKEEFERSTSYKANFNDFINLLDNSKDKYDTKNNNPIFSAIFWNLPTNLSRQEEINIYKKYLLQNWHHEHEEIVGTFQIIFNEDKENIETLLEAIDQIPKYLQNEDLKYSYIRKIIYAIGAQPNPHSIKALENLTNETDDEQIRDLSLHQIEKRKKLGRWEAARNVE